MNSNSLLPTAPRPWQPPFSFLLLWAWLWHIPYVRWIVPHLSCDWLISLSIMSSGSFMLSYIAGFPSFLRLFPSVYGLNFSLIIYSQFYWSACWSDSDGKESDCSAGDPGLILRSRRSPGEGNGYPLQYPLQHSSILA